VNADRRKHSETCYTSPSGEKRNKMSISGISTTNPAYQPTDSAGASAYQQDLQNLGKTLQNGDLAGAQQSFAQMLQDMQSSGQSGSTAQAQA